MPRGSRTAKTSYRVLIAIAFDLRSERNLRRVIFGKISPRHVFVIKAARERGLDDHEVGRNIEIAWRIKR
jgi:hypothetical protein